MYLHNFRKAEITIKRFIGSITNVQLADTLQPLLEITLVQKNWIVVDTFSSQSQMDTVDAVGKARMNRLLTYVEFS